MKKSSLDYIKGSLIRFFDENKSKDIIKKMAGNGFPELERENQFNGIFSVVTGGGKTIFGIYCLAYLFENDLIDSSIIVVPTKTLQDQWASNISSNTNSSINDISFNYKKLSIKLIFLQTYLLKKYPSRI